MEGQFTWNAQTKTFAMLQSQITPLLITQQTLEEQFNTHGLSLYIWLVKMDSLEKQIIFKTMLRFCMEMTLPQFLIKFCHLSMEKLCLKKRQKYYEILRQARSLKKWNSLSLIDCIKWLWVIILLSLRS